MSETRKADIYYTLKNKLKFKKMEPKTLYDKIWDTHCVKSNKNGFDLLYIDRHYIHEVTSPQAFEGLRISERKPWRSSSNFAVPDHNIPQR